jgi:hypothetical protein
VDGSGKEERKEKRDRSNNKWIGKGIDSWREGKERGSWKEKEGRRGGR